MDNKKGKSGLAMILIVYLLGIFMGAIDTGIVTPAREIIQNNFGVDAKTGIWMITIYTLAYAASIPIMGKLADRVGRKTIYMLSIFLFGFGSLLCGLSQYTGNFWFLIGARALQAIGGGGIVPIATAEFGTSFPQEKRGMALGLVGAVYGIANIFGSLAGSAILDAFGAQHWQYIFFVNVPITAFIMIAGAIFLKNNRDQNPKKIDVVGILVITAMVLSLLYGLRNIDFFNFSQTLTSTAVYPYLIAFIVLLPVFIITEKKAEDPIINLGYFTNIKIVITLLVAFAAGFVLMGIVFIPQFSENALKVRSGNGGYFTMILGLLAGVSAALSGKLIDKLGAKIVLILGFAIAIAGALFLIFVTAASPAVWNVILSLALLGFGLGFTMGAPINYMMLDNICDKDASAGLATLSLIRSIGTTIAPALMVGFIAHAGMSLQPNLTAVLPDTVKVPDLPYVQDITAELDKLKSDPNAAPMLSGVAIPDLSAMQTVKLDFGASDGSVKVPEELLLKFRSSDVTSAVAITKEFAGVMFDQYSPMLLGMIQGGIQSGLDGVGKGIAGAGQGLEQQQLFLTQLQAYEPKLTGPLPAGMSLLDMLPQEAKAHIPEQAQSMLKEITTPDELKAQEAAFQRAIDAMGTQIGELETLRSKMQALYDAVPGALTAAQAGYLAEIDGRSAVIEQTYQATLNGGYRSIYLIVAVASAAAIVVLVFYRKKKNDTDKECFGEKEGPA
jgi:EmrB/QacA subfamily drug resistance transporter